MENRATVRPLPQTDVNNIQMAIRDLKSTRDRLRFAGADRAADYVARALKSTEGALRHAQGKVARYETANEIDWSKVRIARTY